MIAVQVGDRVHHMQRTMSGAFQPIGVPLVVVKTGPKVVTLEASRGHWTERSRWPRESIKEPMFQRVES